MHRPVLLQFHESQPTDFRLALAPVPDWRVERGKEIERDIGWLIAARIGMRNVVAQGADSRLAREDARRLPAQITGSRQPRYQTRRDGFNVPLDPRNLSGKENIRMLP